MDLDLFLRIGPGGVGLLVQQVAAAGHVAERFQLSQGRFFDVGLAGRLALGSRSPVQNESADEPGGGVAVISQEVVPR